MVELRVATTGELVPRELVALRLLMDSAFAGNFSNDDWDHTMGGLHVLAVADGIAAHAAVVERTLTAGDRSLRTGYVEGVATAESHRSRGLGSMVMRRAGQVILESYELGALSTGVPDFFVSLGWEPWRGPTYANAPTGFVRTEEEDDTIFVMRTPATRDLDTTLPLACDWRSGDVW